MGWSIVDLYHNPHAVHRQNGQPDKERDTAKQLVLLATSVCASLCELGSWAGCWCSRLASADVHFRVIWLRPKGNNYTEEAAGARHTHMTVPSHYSRLKPLGRSPHQTKITCGTEGFSRRLASVRDFAGAQPRAGQKKCERGRESAAPGKLVSSRGRYRRRLRGVFGREEEARAKSKAGGFSTPSAGYTRLRLQIVAQPPARRTGVGR